MWLCVAIQYHFEIRNWESIVKMLWIVHDNWKILRLQLRIFLISELHNFIWLFEGENLKGPSIYDVRKIFWFFDPSSHVRIWYWSTVGPNSTYRQIGRLIKLHFGMIDREKSLLPVNWLYSTKAPESLYRVWCLSSYSHNNQSWTTVASTTFLNPILLPYFI